MASKPLFQQNTFIYLVRRPENVSVGYDAYESFVVVAHSACDPKLLHPAGNKVEYDHENEKWIWAEDGDDWGMNDWPSDFLSLVCLDIKCIGRARHGMESGEVICANFKAG